MLKNFALVLAVALSGFTFAAPATTPPSSSSTAETTKTTHAKPVATKSPAEATKSPSPEKAKSVSNPKVILHTSMGDITVELFADKAPKTVQNFLDYVKEDFYSGTVFHRVIDGFMIQGGGFTKELVQKPTHASIQNEATNHLSNLRGTIAIARTNDPHSATSQFFINVQDNKGLDYTSDKDGRTWGYCVFGKVTSGMEVVDKIKAVPTAPQGPLPSDVPTTPVVIEKVESVK